MRIKLFMFFSMVCIICFYIASYCCIYTAVVMFEVLKPLEPEYRCKDMTGTCHYHAYVHVGGYNLFLNPFRAYGGDYRVYRSTDDFIKASPNWGYLYIPILDLFINKNKATI